MTSRPKARERRREVNVKGKSNGQKGWKRQKYMTVKRDPYQTHNTF